MNKLFSLLGAVTVAGTAALAISMAVHPEFREHLCEVSKDTYNKVKSMHHCPLCSGCNLNETDDIDDTDD